jgi:predicted PurR-regulated permease PerM
MLIAKESFKGYSKRFVAAAFRPDIAEFILDVSRRGNQIFYGFIIGKIIDSIIIGIICWIGMTILGLNYSMLCSFIVGVTNVIPVFGPYIGALPTVILLFVTDPPQGIIFLIYILVLQQVDGNLIGPKILGDSTGISPFWVIFAIVVGGGLFGFLGMLLGVPTIALLLYILDQLTIRRCKEKNLPEKPADYV